MKIKVYENPHEVGKASAEQAAEIVNKAIKENGRARIVLSTGASQFDFFENFVKQDIDFSKVEMFHLDEYVGVSVEHKASFVKYLQERFVSKVNLKSVHFVDGTGEPKIVIEKLTKELREAPIDLGLIGIGENAHIAFNDPPADFDTDAAYIVVNLNDDCKKQQIREGWFKTVDEVCKQAISMTCKEIMKCKKVISVVPYPQKAQAIAKVVENDVTNTVPATLLKKHADCTIYCDKDSIALADKELLKKYL